MKTNIQKTILFLLAFGLIVPHLPLLKDAKRGLIELIPNKFSYLKWKTSEFQNNFTTNFNTDFNSINFLTRLKNQLDYSFFNESVSTNLVIGNGGFLFEKSDYNSNEGLNYIGDNYNKTQLNRLQYISDRLAHQNKKLIIALSPSKSTNVNKQKAAKTNYKTFIDNANNYELNIIDFNAVVTDENVFQAKSMNIKAEKSFYMLDSLLNYTSKELKTPLKKPSLIGITEIADTSYSNPLNLLFSKKSTSELLDVAFEETALANKKVLLIGDNSAKPLFETNFITEVFGDGTFWLNGVDIINSKDQSYLMPFDKTMLTQEVNKSDVIIMFINPSNIDHFAFGTLDYIYDYLSPEGGIALDEYSEYENNCETEKHKILLNDEHKNLVYTQARQKNINYYDNLRGHAEYALSLQDRGWNYESNKFTDFQSQRILVKNQLLKDASKLAKLKIEAKKNNWDLESWLNKTCREIVEKQNINGAPNVRDNLSPLHLAILNTENQIMMDSAWFVNITNQAKEKKITLAESLWSNAEYMLWTKYDPYFNSLDEAKRWVGELHYLNEVKRRKDWLTSIDALSKAKNISADDFVRKNALYLIFANKKRTLEYNEDQVYSIINQINIRNDKNWSKNVADDAKKKNLTFEECIKEHAEYIRFMQKQNGG